MELVIKVTDQDLSEGERYSIASCPVGIAVLRAFGKATAKVQVSNRYISIVHENVIYDSVMKEEEKDDLERYMKHWDRYGDAHPRLFRVKFERRIQ